LLELHRTRLCVHDDLPGLLQGWFACLPGAGGVSRLKFEWQQAIRQPGHGLTITQLAVLHTFATFADADGRACPSVPTLAKAVGIKDRAIQKAFAGAETVGWIAAPDHRPGGASTVWRQLTIPTPVRQDTTTPVRQDTRNGVPREQQGVSVGTPKEKRQAISQQHVQASAREDPTFSALFEGVGLQAAGRARAYEIWQDERERVEACVEEWWCKKERNPTTGPGLLLRMLEDGDYPSVNRRRRPEPKPVCPNPDCGLGDGRHVDGCSLAGVAA
jgi:hypothetical protein